MRKVSDDTFGFRLLRVHVFHSSLSGRRSNLLIAALENGWKKHLGSCFISQTANSESFNQFLFFIRRSQCETREHKNAA